MQKTAIPSSFSTYAATKTNIMQKENKFNNKLYNLLSHTEKQLKKYLLYIILPNLKKNHTFVITSSITI